MDILDKFIENAKQSLKEGYYDIPEEAHVKKASLRKKLDSQQFSLITEIKHASPAGEYSFSDIDVEKAAMDFLRSGSDAISVVVEPKIFKGSLANVATAKKSGLPVLFKDFVLDERQIEAARKAGADALLLVVKVARRENLDLDNLIKTAHKNGLEVLLECYDEDEMHAALATGADILGINNRDLQTLKVDITRTAGILAKVKPDRPVISESGIKTRADAEFVKKAGARGLLAGTVIWTAPDLKEKVRELRV
ncbi:Indole-3-glycerol phosphate synthase [uncultured archaeon]|nr:Indole-3-glycerol phosphate synthase [uncultured archaeon]